MAHIAALSIDSFLARWQGGEQEELCIGGVYEPGLEVGNSAFIPVAKIQSHCQRVLKGRLENVIQLCGLKENDMNVVILFPTGCCCLSDPLV